MNKLLASIVAASAAVAFSSAALAECAGHDKTAQSSKPVVTADGAMPSTPIPTTPKSGS
jgi:ABC-type oligopeptide transport system substrate-binding subunit